MTNATLNERIDSTIKAIERADNSIYYQILLAADGVEATANELVTANHHDALDLNKNALQGLHGTMAQANYIRNKAEEMLDTLNSAKELLQKVIKES